MKATADRLINDYRRELRHELADLPRATRREVLDEVDEHITQALAEIDSDDEAAVRNMLERLGDPAEIADAARDRFGLRRQPLGAREIAALVLLLIGGFIVPFVGWLAGVVLLWSSEAWTTRQKLLGTLVFPGGLFLPVFMFFFGAYTADSEPSGLEKATSIALFLTLLLAPIVVAVSLARQQKEEPPGQAALRGNGGGGSG